MEVLRSMDHGESYSMQAGSGTHNWATSYSESSITSTDHHDDHSANDDPGKPTEHSKDTRWADDCNSAARHQQQRSPYQPTSQCDGPRSGSGDDYDDDDSSAERVSKTVLRYCPPGFEPGGWDVICQRGKQNFDHLGNLRLRLLAENYLPKFKVATGKKQKSAIVTSIFEIIHRQAASVNGRGFVRRDLLHRRWFEVTGKIAREKIGQSLRDALSHERKRLEQRQKQSQHMKDSRGSSRNPGQFARLALPNSSTQTGSEVATATGLKQDGKLAGMIGSSITTDPFQRPASDAFGDNQAHYSSLAKLTATASEAARRHTQSCATNQAAIWQQDRNDNTATTNLHGVPWSNELAGDMQGKPACASYSCAGSERGDGSKLPSFSSFSSFPPSFMPQPASQFLFNDGSPAIEASGSSGNAGWTGTTNVSSDRTKASTISDYQLWFQQQQQQQQQTMLHPPGRNNQALPAPHGLVDSVQPSRQREQSDGSMNQLLGASDEWMLQQIEPAPIFPGIVPSAQSQTAALPTNQHRELPTRDGHRNDSRGSTGNCRQGDV